MFQDLKSSKTPRWPTNIATQNIRRKDSCDSIGGLSCISHVHVWNQNAWWTHVMDMLFHSIVDFVPLVFKNSNTHITHIHTHIIWVIRYIALCRNPCFICQFTEVLPFFWCYWNLFVHIYYQHISNFLFLQYLFMVTVDNRQVFIADLRM